MSIYPNKSLQNAVTLQFCGKAGTYPAQAMNDEISGVPFASNMELDAVIEMGTPVVWDADGVRPVEAGDSNIYGVACFSYGVLADQSGYRKGNLNLYIPVKRKGYVVVKLDSLQDAVVDAPVTIDAENKCYKLATGSDKVYGRIDTIFPEYGTVMIEMRNIIEIKPVATKASGYITINENPYMGQELVIGSTTYHFSDVNQMIAASGSITVNENPLTGQELVIGSTTYHFSDTGSLSANDIKIGESVNATAANIAAAINAIEGAGTMYGTGTVPNTDATAHNYDNVVNVIAQTSGVAGNSVVFTTTSGNLSLTNSGTLAGGSDTTPLAINDIQIGESATATAMNITAAINAAEGAGTIYGTGTVPNTDANATFVNNKVHVEAIVAGAAGNSIAFTTNSDSLSLSGSGTLTGGFDA